MTNYKCQINDKTQISKEYSFDISHLNFELDLKFDI